MPNLNMLGKFLKSCHDNYDNFLFVTAAIGWVLSSAAQIVGLCKNKEISKEEKKFLIPREVADSIINIGSYALITIPLMKFAKNRASSAYTAKEAIQGASTVAAVAGGVVASNIITPLVRNKAGMVVKHFIDKYDSKPRIQKTQYIHNGARMNDYLNRVRIYPNSITKI